MIKFDEIGRRHLVCFDVDDTLILHHRKPQPGDIVHYLTHNNLKEHEVIVHTKHVDMLKRHKQFGKCWIIVWSWGGADWAELVVKTLGLEDYVDLVTGKPFKYYDDLAASEWMGKPVYYPHPFRGSTP